MNAASARISAVAIALFLAVSVGVLVATSSKTVRGTEVRAEFKNAWPLVEGMSVRISGAVAGKVNRIELTRRGTALITMDLHDGLPPLRADASAAIRQQDLLGDSYLSVSPGRAAAPLRGTIPPARAIQLPRFDDFFDIFKAPVRDGLRVFALEMSRALERRGTDLNGAILRVRPAIDAVDAVMAELRGQNGALSRALTSARAVSRQAASRSGDIDRSVTDLSAILATVAQAAPQLDQSLKALPASLTRSQTSLRGLRRALTAATPVTRELASGAGEFAAAGRALATYPAQIRPAVSGATTLLAGVTSTLSASSLALARLNRVDFGLLSPTATFLSQFAQVFGKLADGLIGTADGRGGLVGFVPSEKRSLTDPDTDPARGYLPIFLTPSCELLGRPVAPGCLTQTLAGASPARAGSKALPPAATPAVASPATPLPAPTAPSKAPKVTLPPVVQNTLDGVLGTVTSLLGGPSKTAPDGRLTHDLLDFLLKP